MSCPPTPGVLMIFGGLPGTGKTSVARELARRLGGIHLRVDTIEQAIRDSGRMVEEIYDAGYRVAYALAADNLRLSHVVIADSVNPIEVTRSAWREVAESSGIRYIEVEVICSDPAEHRRRVEHRKGDIATLKLPSWQHVVNREYEPWKSPDLLVLDTAVLTVEAAADQIRARLALLGP